MTQDVVPTQTEGPNLHVNCLFCGEPNESSGEWGPRYMPLKTIYGTMYICFNCALDRGVRLTVEGYQGMLRNGILPQMRFMPQAKLPGIFR